MKYKCANKISKVTLFLSSTALIIACELGNVEIAEMILQNGANIDKRGQKEK